MVPKSNRKSLPDEIAEKAMNGENISHYFTNKGAMRPAVQRPDTGGCTGKLTEPDSLSKKSDS
jgi:hypothetical protein